MLSKIWTCVFGIEEPRPLTDGEVALARSVYGEHIDYSKVTIIKTTEKMPRASAMVIGNEVFYRESYYEDDFSQMD